MKWVIGLMTLLSATFAFAQTWSPQNSGTSNQFQGVAFVDVSTGWVVGRYGTILHTTNGGSTWFAQSSGTPEWLFGVAFVDANTGWAVGKWGIILHTTDGSTWAAQSSGSANHLWGVAFVNAGNGWVVGDGGTIRHTTNGGSTWVAQSSGTTQRLNGVDFVDTNQGWAVGGYGMILHTTNGGSTWVAQSSGSASDLWSVDFVDTNIGWAVGNVVRHTTNGGSTWVPQNGETTPTLYAVAFVDTYQGWAIGYNGIILHTTNSGNTWVAQNSGTMNHLYGVALFDECHGWAVGTYGTILYYYSLSQFRVLFPNGGEQWHIFQSDTIRWTSCGYEGPVSIELNRFYSGGTWETLADSTENDGVEAFYITDPLSDHCRVRISALEDTLSDISDADFSITSSQGYLALVQNSTPNTPILTWNAVVECPQTATANYRLKNFGNETIVLFQPLEPITQEFSRTTTCGSFFALAPSQMSVCSLTISFDPTEDGVYYDTLLIQTDAINAVNGYVRIPLVGQRISTPAAPITVLSLEGNHARLTWEPITESILGCPVTPTGYLIFYSETYAGPYYFLNCTPDTTYLHTWVVRFAPSMFYDVIAITEPLSRLDFINGNVNYTREEILERLH